MAAAWSGVCVVIHLVHIARIAGIVDQPECRGRPQIHSATCVLAPTNRLRRGRSRCPSVRPIACFRLVLTGLPDFPVRLARQEGVVRRSGDHAVDVAGGLACVPRRCAQPRGPPRLLLEIPIRRKRVMPVAAPGGMPFQGLDRIKPGALPATQGQRRSGASWPAGPGAENRA